MVHVPTEIVEAGDGEGKQDSEVDLGQSSVSDLHADPQYLQEVDDQLESFWCDHIANQQHGVRGREVGTDSDIGQPLPVQGQFGSRSGHMREGQGVGAYRDMQPAWQGGDGQRHDVYGARQSGGGSGEIQRYYEGGGDGGQGQSGPNGGPQVHVYGNVYVGRHQQEKEKMEQERIAREQGEQGNHRAGGEAAYRGPWAPPYAARPQAGQGAWIGR